MLEARAEHLLIGAEPASDAVKRGTLQGSVQIGRLVESLRIMVGTEAPGWALWHVE